MEEPLCTIGTESFLDNSPLSIEQCKSSFINSWECNENLTTQNSQDFCFFKLDKDNLVHLKESDLMLEDQESNLVYTVTTDQQYVQKIYSFINSILNDKAKVSSTQKKIINLINEIIKKSGYSDAEILIELQQKKDLPFIDRHIDKSQLEIITKKLFPDKQSGEDLKFFRYIVNLSGDSTFYYECPLGAKEKFLALSSEAPSSHGEYGSNNSEKINLIMNSCRQIETPKEHGSSHLMGKSGAIHARPFVHDSRLLLVVTPNMPSVIKLMNHINLGEI